jgi:plastocyanin
MNAHPAGRAAAALAAVALGLAAACAPPEPRSHSVEIRGFAYLPATLEIVAGDTVVWINRDAVPHTATGDGRGWDSDTLDTGEAWRLVAAQRGSQPYYCAFHPTMRGELVVR